MFSENYCFVCFFLNKRNIFSPSLVFVISVFPGIILDRNSYRICGYYQKSPKQKLSFLFWEIFKEQIQTLIFTGKIISLFLELSQD